MADRYPPPIYSTDPGSWAQTTVSQRFPEITRRMMAENDFSPEVKQQLTELINEIGSGTIRQLRDQGAPDQEDWQGYLASYLGKNWFEVPWFVAEHYFYRRIMEAVNYFQLGQDPFNSQKRQGLETSYQETASLARFLAEVLGHPDQRQGSLLEALYFSLWGNQADLSLWPAGSEDTPRHDSQSRLREHLLANDIRQVTGRVLNLDPQKPRVDILLDNAGFELVADLGLADILLGLELCESVVLHVKAHPTFVSDVIAVDIEGAISYLAAAEEAEVREFGGRLEGYRTTGRLVSRADYYWNSPLPLWKFPEELGAEWTSSSLLISKGDANYRRILGDRQWDFTTTFPEAVDYLPLPLAALRTLKAELAVGLTLDQIQEVFNQDRNWLINGRWGVIHYAPGKRG